MREHSVSGCLHRHCCTLLRQVIGAWCQGQCVDWRPLDDTGWEGLISESRLNGVSGVLYKLLPDDAPSSVRDVLRSDYQSQLAANILYLEKLGQIVPALKSAGVRFVVVKGAALLATVYSDMGMRAMKDVDLLVHHEDANILKPVMQQLGWQEEDEDIAGKHFGQRYRAETSFTRREGALLLRLEAHLDAPGVYPLAREAIWRKLVFVSAAGIDEMPVLSVPAHLNYLCTHFYYHHCGQGLKWLVDVALLIPQVRSWHDVVVDAYELGTTRPMHLALHDAARYLQVPVPTHIVETLRFLPMPLSLRLLFEMCKRSSLHYLGIRLLDLYRAPNWSTRLGYIWRKLTAPRWRRRALQRE
ncbi:MAG: nucleotidyltransferase family protein [Armatimonadota bacterium]|nr:nucleotidyltransferase family protein [bacterium]MDW8320359.1 nucleotidyltransferase family protein [Armatimonadota bacterium]